MQRVDKLLSIPFFAFVLSNFILPPARITWPLYYFLENPYRIPHKHPLTKPLFLPPLRPSLSRRFAPQAEIFLPDLLSGAVCASLTPHPLVKNPCKAVAAGKEGNGEVSILGAVAAAHGGGG
jgi:hypothetical protein